MIGTICIHRFPSFILCDNTESSFSAFRSSFPGFKEEPSLLLLLPSCHSPQPPSQAPEGLPLHVPPCHGTALLHVLHCNSIPQQETTGSSSELRDFLLQKLAYDLPQKHGEAVRWKILQTSHFAALVCFASSISDKSKKSNFNVAPFVEPFP